MIKILLSKTFILQIKYKLISQRFKLVRYFVDCPRKNLFQVKYKIVMLFIGIGKQETTMFMTL